MRALSHLRRMTAATAACLLLAAATGLPHEHPADHDGERAHVEIPHGGHGTVLDLPAPRIRSDAPPPPIPCLHAESPDWRPASSHAESERAPRRIREPRARPPPRPYRARAPPLS